MQVIDSRLQEKSEFVPMCHIVVLLVTPNQIFILRQEYKPASRLPLKKKCSPKTTHFCLHCGAAWHSHPNYFKYGYVYSNHKNIIQFL